MRRFFKRFPFNKLFVSLFVTLYTFLPSTQALGTVIEDYSPDDSVVMDISEDILEEGISDPEEIANPEVLKEEIPESTYEDGVYTVNNVELEEYVYPDDENVRVRFTRITEEGNLVISKVELTKEEKEELNTSDDYGWDITSTMSNGSFTYDLTLPNTLGEDVEVKYTEDGEIYTSIDDTVVNEDVIHIEGLDHFTVFVIVEPGNDSTIATDCDKVQLNGDQCFDTIQEAVDAASGGETIYVGAGTYQELNGLSIGVSLTIVGKGENETTVQVSRPSGGYGIRTTDNNPNLQVTLRDISFEAISGVSNFFFHIAHNKSFTLENSTVIGMGKNHYSGGESWSTTVGGVDIIDVESASLKNVTVKETSRNAVSFSAVKNITVESITIEDNGAREGSAGLAIYNRPDYAANNPENISIDGGLITGSPIGINLGDTILNVVEDDDIKNLSFVNNVLQAVGSPGELENLLAYNDFDKAVVVRNNPIVVPVIYSDIQSAISVASSGNTIEIYDGAYLEEGQILVDKDLTIIGENRETTIIKPSGNITNWILVEEDVNFSLKNVTLDGQGRSIRVAIRTYGSGVIENNIIKNIRHSQYLGWGIALTWSTPNQSWDIKNNVFEDIERVGVLVDGQNNEASITGNSFYGKGEGDWVEYGIEVGDGAYAFIEKNFISDYKGIASSDGSVSSGILITSYFGPNPEARIQKNTITDNSSAILVGYDDNDSSIVTANYNNITNNSTYGISNGAETEIDATLNWWGHYTGPSGEGGGSGDKVSSNISYQEWLCEPYSTEWVSQNGTCSINTPEQTGYNVNDGTPASEPRSPNQVTCNSGYTNINGVAIHWTDVSYQNPKIKYQRQYKINNGSWSGNEIYTTPYTGYRSFGSSIGSDGIYGSRVRAFYDTNDDGQYNIGELVSGWSNECSITYDKTPPSTPPSQSLKYEIDGGEHVCGSYTSSYNVVAQWGDSSDTNGIDYYEYQSFNPPTGWTWPNDDYGVEVANSERAGAFTIGEGTYGFRVRSVDRAGNKSDWTATDFNTSCKITYDTTAPVVTIETPSQGDYIRGTVNLIGNIEELNLWRYFYRIRNSLTNTNVTSKTVYASSLNDETYYTWDTTKSPDGEYHLQLAARDLANNRNSNSEDNITVTVDNTAPYVEIIQPEDGGHLNGTVDIRGLVTDDNLSHYNIAIYHGDDDVRDFSLRIEQKTEYTPEFGEKTLYTWDTTNGNFPDGEYQIRLAAKDLAGNRDLDGPSEEVITVIVDNTSPESTITTPSSGYITNETPEIIGYTEDTYSVDKVVLSYTDYDTDTQQCGAEWTELTTIDNPNKETLPFDWSYSEWDLEDGAYCIKAQGTDLAGNEEHTAIVENVTYDTTAPQITLLDLVLGVLNVTADDLLSGTDKIEVSTGNGIWEDYTPDMDLNDLVGNQPGTYTIYIRVTDKAGNTTQDSVTFTIPSPTPTTTQTGGEILGVTSPLNPTSVQAFGTGGPIITQTEEQDTEEDEETEEEVVTQDDAEVKGEEDNGEENNEEESTEGEGTKWWIYPLVILPILAIFIILWKRRKEDNEPQF